MMLCSFRRSVRSALLIVSAASHALAQGGSNTMPVPDPGAGAVAAVLPLPPGWHGHAYMDRTTDPLSNGVATAVLDVSSADGRIHLQTLPWQFHTYSPVQQRLGAEMPGDPAHARNVAFIHFRSSADLLQNHILPLLQLSAHPANISSATQQQRFAALQQMGPGAIFDAAMVVFNSGGRDAVVTIISSGGAANTAQEVTGSMIAILTAPSGQGLNVWEQLQKTLLNPSVTPQWQQANNQYLERWRQQRMAESNAIVAHNHQVGQTILARDRRTQQAIDESAAYSAAVVGDKNLYLKWCDSSGASQTTVNQITPPAPGYQRCN